MSKKKKGEEMGLQINLAGYPPSLPAPTPGKNPSPELDHDEAMARAEGFMQRYIETLKALA